MLGSDFVTQCPNCDTTFRVTEAQLAAAHGAVRCGACLQVFAANDHLIQPEPTVSEPAITEPAVTAPMAGLGVASADFSSIDTAPTDTPEIDSSSAENDNLGVGELFEADTTIDRSSNSTNGAKLTLRSTQVEVSESTSELQSEQSADLLSDASAEFSSSDPVSNQILRNRVENAGKTTFGVDYFVTEGMSETITEVDEIEDRSESFSEDSGFEGNLAAAKPEQSRFAQRLDRTEVDNISGPDEVALGALFEDLNVDSGIASQSEMEAPSSKYFEIDALDPQAEHDDDLGRKMEFSQSDVSDDDALENNLDMDAVEADPRSKIEEDPDLIKKDMKAVVDVQDLGTQEVDLQAGDVQEFDIEEQEDSFDASSERMIPANGYVMLGNLDDDLNESLENVADINFETEMPEAIVGDYQVPVKSHNLRWFLGSVILAAVLASQYAYVNIELLVQQPKLRPYYALFCNYADCDLPAFEDVASIETTELVVRAHPEIERVLLVDAIIRNTAIYRQAFPPLEMKFTGLNNLVIASRLFLPKEYLGGEMLGLKFIPARTEVRLGLEIVDPGENAFGHSLEAIYPQ